MQTLWFDRKEAAKTLLDNLKRLYSKLAPKDQEAVKMMIFEHCLPQPGSN
jgi:hypothetical protein